ncbi:hypothetical protein D3C72_1709820 [compost metagenome]
MPDLLGLGLDRFHEVRMGVAQRIDRYAGRKIQISFAALREQPDALASLEAQGGSCKRIEQWRGGFGHGCITPCADALSDGCQ